MNKNRTPYNDMFYKAVLALKDAKECAAFFEDLCTIKELQSMAQRLVVAQMLTENYVYSEIVEKTGASTATISRVNRSLMNGSNGYATIFKRIQKDRKNV